MCGIAGWSLSANSNIPVRQLAHHMLALSEPRGRDASGWAYQAGDKVATYKRPIPGGALRVRSLPTSARTVILHTRNTTVGDVSDNNNNHPVVSPSKRISLIHNGVVTNHDSFRLKYTDLPEVDSAVIPSLLEDYGAQGLGELSASSWAALAWLDTQTPDTLHLATTQGAPLILVGLTDGSLLFASTFEAILDSMKAVGIEDMFAWGYSAPQFTHLRVTGGSISFMENVPEYSFAKARFKPSAKVMTKAEIDRLHHITSGEVASKDSPPPLAVKPPPPPVTGKPTPVSWVGGGYTSVTPRPPGRDPNGPNAFATGEINDIMAQLDKPTPTPVVNLYKPHSKSTPPSRWGSRDQFPSWLVPPVDLRGSITYWLQTSVDPLPWVGFLTFADFWETLDDWLYESDLVEDPTFDCGIIGLDGELHSLTAKLPQNLGLSPHEFFAEARRLLKGGLSDFSATQYVTMQDFLVTPPDGVPALDHLDSLGLLHLDVPSADLFRPSMAIDDYDDDWDRPVRMGSSDEFHRVNNFLKSERADEVEGFLRPPQVFTPTSSGGYKEVKDK